MRSSSLSSGEDPDGIGGVSGYGDANGGDDDSGGDEVQ